MRTEHTFSETRENFGDLFNAVRTQGVGIGHNDLAGFWIQSSEMYDVPRWRFEYVEGRQPPTFEGIQDDVGGRGGQGPVFNGHGRHVHAEAHFKPLRDFDYTVMEDVAHIFTFEFKYAVLGFTEHLSDDGAPRGIFYYTTGHGLGHSREINRHSDAENDWVAGTLSVEFEVERPRDIEYLIVQPSVTAGRFVQWLSFSYSFR